MRTSLLHAFLLAASFALALPHWPSSGAYAIPTLGPPDPRRGENLDGRVAYVDPHRGQLAVPRVVLAVPKYTLGALSYPFVKLGNYADKHHWYPQAYWFLTSDDKLIRVRPILQYGSGFSPVIGLRVDDRRTLGEGSRLHLDFKTSGPSLVSVEGSLRPPDELGVPVELRVGFERNTQAIFGGTNGLDSEELEELNRHAARYRFTRTSTSLVYEEPVGFDWLTLRVQADLDLRTYGNGSESSSDPPINEAWCVVPGASCNFVDPVLVPGFDEGLRLGSGTAFLRVDTRRAERFRRGLLAGLGATYAHGLFENDDQFVRVGAGAGYTIGGTSHALSASVRGGFVDGLDGTTVPFEELWSPTGADGVRGIRYGEIRGASAAVGTLEYRWLLAPWLDATLFVDYGGAADLWFEDFSERLVPSYGVGLWAYGGYQNEHWLAKPWGSLQVAVAPSDGWRLLFNVDSDFLW